MVTAGPNCTLNAPATTGAKLALVLQSQAQAAAFFAALATPLTADTIVRVLGLPCNRSSVLFAAPGTSPQRYFDQANLPALLCAGGSSRRLTREEEMGDDAEAEEDHLGAGAAGGAVAGAYTGWAEAWGATAPPTATPTATLQRPAWALVHPLSSPSARPALAQLCRAAARRDAAGLGSAEEVEAEAAQRRR